MHKLNFDIQQPAFALLGLALALSISAGLMAGGLLVLLWSWSAYKNRNEGSFKFPLSNFDIPLLTFAVWAIFVTLLYGSTSLRKALSVQSSFLFYFMFLYFARPCDVRTFVKWFLIGSGVIALWSFCQIALKSNYFPTSGDQFISGAMQDWPQWLSHKLSLRNGRPTGTRSHPLTFAEGLIPAYFILGGLLLARLKNGLLPFIKSWASIILMGLICMALVVSQGRAVWLGILMGSPFLLFILPKRARVVLFSVGVIVIGLVYAFSPTVQRRANSIVQMHATFQPDQDSKSTRFRLWSAALEDFKAKPILGYGSEGVSLEIREVDSAELRAWSEAHNIFFQCILEKGLIGFGLFIWLIVIMVKNARLMPSHWKWITLGCLTSFFICGLTESWLHDKEISMIFWALVGCAEFIRIKGAEI